MSGAGLSRSDKCPAESVESYLAVHCVVDSLVDRLVFIVAPLVVLTVAAISRYWGVVEEDELKYLAIIPCKSNPKSLKWPIFHSSQIISDRRRTRTFLRVTENWYWQSALLLPVVPVSQINIKDFSCISCDHFTRASLHWQVTQLSSAYISVSVYIYYLVYFSTRFCLQR